MVKAVCDAGPIIHLDELKCLELLSDFEEIIIPFAVGKEIEKHRPSALQNSDIHFNRLSVRSSISENLMRFCQVFSLDIGEAEALALMEINAEAIFFTDDAAARLVAEQMRLKVHGTIGVIIRSIRRKHKNPKTVLNILKSIPEKSTLHVKPSLLGEILFMIKKEFHI